MKSILRAIVFFIALAATPALAQWQVAAHAVPIGRGPGITGFTAATTGTSGRLLIDQGSGADPAFEQMTGDCSILSNGTITCSASGSGTVTSVSVVSANGLAGTVANPTTTPAITLSTTVTGVLQGNGTTISAATTTGTGSVVLGTGPTIASPTVTGAFTATGLVTNADLANPATTVNGQTCTLGSTCTVSTTPSGSAGGDLSGTYPNPTVAKVNGVSYPSSPSTNTVPVVTGSNAATYTAMPNIAAVYSAASYGVKCDGSTDDTSAIAAAIAALPSTGGTIVFPPTGHPCVISSTITIGNGTSSSNSTINGIALVGGGSGNSAAESFPVDGPTTFKWTGSSGGTAFTVAGPITGVKLSGLVVDCNSLCNTGFNLVHPMASRFEELLVENWKAGYAYIWTAYSNGTSLATGSQHNTFIQVRAANPNAGGGASGILIGAASTGSSPHLDTALSDFIGGQFTYDASVSSGVGIALQFVDNIDFTGTATAPQGGSSGIGLKIIPASGDTTFPGSITFTHPAILGGVNNPGSGWTATTGIGFFGYATGDGEAVPVANGASQFYGVTDTGLPFGLNGTLANITAGHVTTNANLTGPITSSGNATSIASQTGTGSKFVVDTSPTLITPVLGVAAATSINKVALTAPATGSTLTVADGKTLTANKTLTLTGTDGTTETFPSTSATIARTDAGQTFTGTQVFSTPIALSSGGLGIGSGTSGGIPYFSSSSAVASSAALAANSLVAGGGAGAAPFTTGCTVSGSDFANVSCASSNSDTPQFGFTNNTSDSAAANIVFQKSRSAGNVLNGDHLGDFFFEPFQSSAYTFNNQLSSRVDGAPSGANVPAKLIIQNGNTAGTTTQMIFDSKGHLGYSPATLPAITSCGSSPSAATGSDAGGQVTEGSTATGCTITFAAAYAAAPFCTVSLQTQQAAFSYTLSASAIVVTNTSATGDKINWVCHGN